MADSSETLRTEVQEYYSENLSCREDLKTDLKCNITNDSRPRELIKFIHEAVKNKYYGCGLVAPEVLEGLNILDLGCGAGMDCFMLAKLVGPNGLITGVDMTDDQLKTANEYIEYHRQAFGYEKANTVFVKSYIEDLKAAGIKDNSQDVIVSNCVINLTADKRQALQEAFRVLKNGGEMYFSDIYTDKEIPDNLKKDKVLWGECLSGALPWEGLYSLAEEIGFCTPVAVTVSPVVIKDSKLEPLLEGYRFVSVTYRLFKCPEAENEGPVSATYLGGISKSDEQFDFATSLKFKIGETKTVPAEIGSILQNSRFSKYFQVGKSDSKQCVSALKKNPFDQLSGTPARSACCC